MSSSVPPWCSRRAQASRQRRTTSSPDLVRLKARGIAPLRPSPTHLPYSTTDSELPETPSLVARLAGDLKFGPGEDAEWRAEAVEGRQPLRLHCEKLTAQTDDQRSVVNAIALVREAFGR